MSPAPPVILAPLGDLDAAVVPYLPPRLQAVFGAQVIWGPALAVPRAAYNSRRRQYQAERFLPLLDQVPRTTGALVLGVTAVDLYVPRLNFVFGLAAEHWGLALISLARLHPRFYHLPPNPEVLCRRAGVEAVHELGHLRRLDHCARPDCVMFFSNTLADTDRKGDDFCPRCRALLENPTPP